jgi:hypothetical protein
MRALVVAGVAGFVWSCRLPPTTAGAPTSMQVRVPASVLAGHATELPMLLLIAEAPGTLANRGVALPKICDRAPRSSSRGPSRWRRRWSSRRGLSDLRGLTDSGVRSYHPSLPGHAHRGPCDAVSPRERARRAGSRGAPRDHGGGHAMTRAINSQRAPGGLGVGALIAAYVAAPCSTLKRSDRLLTTRQSLATPARPPLRSQKTRRAQYRPW